MSTAELKERLITRITGIEDENLLLEVSHLLEISEDADKLYILSEEQLSVVNEAKEEFKKGKYFTNEEIKKEDEWLDE